MSWGGARRGSPCPRPSRASPASLLHGRTCRIRPDLALTSATSRLSLNLSPCPLWPSHCRNLPSEGEACSGCGSSLLSAASDGGGTPPLRLPSRSSAVQPRSPGPTVPAAPSADSGMDCLSCRLPADVCTPASTLHPETAACLLVTAHRAQASQSPAPRLARLHWPGAWHIMSFQLKVADMKIRK